MSQNVVSDSRQARSSRLCVQISATPISLPQPDPAASLQADPGRSCNADTCAMAEGLEFWAVRRLEARDTGKSPTNAQG